MKQEKLKITDQNADTLSVILLGVIALLLFIALVLQVLTDQTPVIP